MWHRFNSIKNLDRLNTVLDELKTKNNQKQHMADKLRYVSTIKYNPDKLRFAQTRETLRKII